MINQVIACQNDVANPTDEDRVFPLNALLQSEMETWCEDDGCTDAEAYLVCLEAFPPMLSELAGQLKEITHPRLQIGINLTSTLGLELFSHFSEQVDYISFTNNWVGPLLEDEWEVSGYQTRSATQNSRPFVAFNAIRSPNSGEYLRIAPSAQNHRAMTYLMLLEGAHLLRDFIWPPTSLALLDEMRREQEEFDLFAVDGLSEERLKPDPFVSSPELRAGAFTSRQYVSATHDILLVVVNRTFRALTGRVDVRGLIGEEEMEVTRISEEGSVTVIDGVIEDTWAPFGVRLYRMTRGQGS